MDREAWHAAVHGVYKTEWTEQSSGSTALGQGPVSYSRNMHNNTFEFFGRTGAPPRWRMVTSGWAQDSWSTALLPLTNQSEQSHTPCRPHPKLRLPSLGPVWPLSISWFQANWLLLEGWMLVSDPAQLVKNLSAMWEIHPWVGKVHWRRERLPTPVFWSREFWSQRVGRDKVTFTCFSFFRI